MAIMYTETPELSIITIKLNNNNNRNNTPCICCIWLCQYAHWSSALLNDFFQLFLFVSVCLLVCLSKLPWRAEPLCIVHISVVYPTGQPRIKHTLHVRNNPGEKVGEWRGRTARRRGEKVCLHIIKYLKTATTTFGWEIIGCSIEVGVSWHWFQWLQSIIATWCYMVLQRVKQRTPLKWSYYSHIQI